MSTHDLNAPTTPSLGLRGACLLLMLGGLALGCDTSADEPQPQPDPIIGAWESHERIGGEYNEMEIDDDLEGEATLHFFLGEAGFYADFDVTVEAQGYGEYELEFECDGSCSELDFDAECEIDGDELECEGDGRWEEYEFIWDLQ